MNAGPNLRGFPKIPAALIVEENGLATQRNASARNVATHILPLPLVRPSAQIVQRKDGKTPSLVPFSGKMTAQRAASGA